MVIVIWSLVIYVLSVLMSRWVIQKSYSKGGMWYNLEPTKMDLFFCLLPALNTMVAIQLGLITLLENMDNKLKFNFFKIKK